MNSFVECIIKIVSREYVETFTQFCKSKQVNVNSVALFKLRRGKGGYVLYVASKLVTIYSNRLRRKKNVRVSFLYLT